MDRHVHVQDAHVRVHVGPCTLHVAERGRRSRASPVRVTGEGAHRLSLVQS